MEKIVIPDLLTRGEGFAGKLTTPLPVSTRGCAVQRTPPGSEFDVPLRRRQVARGWEDQARWGQAREGEAFIVSAG